MTFEHVSTQRDIMKETLIYGADLDGKYGFPVLSECNTIPTKTVDIHRSKKLIQVKDLNLNFFVQDYMLNPIWNNPDKYLEHLKCFGSVCGFDFTIDVNSPLALQIYNKYRNHVLSWYFANNGVKVIPKVDILPDCSDWIYDGLPCDSTLCCSTQGRAYSRAAKQEFSECFQEMESILNPHRVIIVGTKIEFLHNERNFMGGHGYETKVAGNLTVAQAKRMFPGINPKSIVSYVLVGGAYTISYKENINGTTVIRTKTIFETAKVKKNKKRK